MFKTPRVVSYSYDSSDPTVVASIGAAKNLVARLISRAEVEGVPLLRKKVTVAGIEVTIDAQSDVVRCVVTQQLEDEGSDTTNLHVEVSQFYSGIIGNNDTFYPTVACSSRFSDLDGNAPSDRYLTDPPYERTGVYRKWAQVLSGVCQRTFSLPADAIGVYRPPQADTPSALKGEGMLEDNEGLKWIVLGESRDSFKAIRVPTFDLSSAAKALLSQDEEVSLVMQVFGGYPDFLRLIDLSDSLATQVWEASGLYVFEKNVIVNEPEYGIPNDEDALPLERPKGWKYSYGGNLRAAKVVKHLDGGVKDWKTCRQKVRITSKKPLAYTPRDADGAGFISSKASLPLKASLYWIFQHTADPVVLDAVVEVLKKPVQSNVEYLCRRINHRAVVTVSDTLQKEGSVWLVEYPLGRGDMHQSWSAAVNTPIAKTEVYFSGLIGSVVSYEPYDTKEGEWRSWTPTDGLQTSAHLYHDALGFEDVAKKRYTGRASSYKYETYYWNKRILVGPSFAFTIYEAMGACPSLGFIQSQYDFQGLQVWEGRYNSTKHDVTGFLTKYLEEHDVWRNDPYVDVRMDVESFILFRKERTTEAVARVNAGFTDEWDQAWFAEQWAVGGVITDTVNCSGVHTHTETGHPGQDVGPSSGSYFEDGVSAAEAATPPGATNYSGAGDWPDTYVVIPGSMGSSTDNLVVAVSLYCSGEEVHNNHGDESGSASLDWDGPATGNITIDTTGIPGEQSLNPEFRRYSFCVSSALGLMADRACMYATSVPLTLVRGLYAWSAIDFATEVNNQQIQFKNSPLSPTYAVGDQPFFVGVV